MPRQPKRPEEDGTKRKQVNLSVADEYLSRFDEVVRHSKQAGLEVTHAMKEVGVISGSIDATKLDDLARVKGVTFVEPAQEYQIAPPESEVQ
jgi:hypothetical protein